MTSVPEAPGAAAVILYRQVDRDDDADHEYNYVRIKILNRRRAENTPTSKSRFSRKAGDVHGVKARTIRPDGSIANFEGKPLEQMIVKAKGVKYLAKVIMLPDVQVGSIIEYRYKSDLQPYYVFDSHWILSEELFTKYAKFSLKPNGFFPVRSTWQSLPARHGCRQETNSREWCGSKPATCRPFRLKTTCRRRTR